MKKFSYYIKWKDAKGKEQVKTYAGIAGRNYWKNKIIKELGDKCIVDEGKELVTESGASQKFSESEKEPLLGPIDQYHSRLSDVPTGRFVMSNWNQKKKVYQSRMYGGLNNYLKVIEPDGAISLQGQNIIKSTDKKNNRTADHQSECECSFCLWI